MSNDGGSSDDRHNDDYDYDRYNDSNSNRLAHDN